MATTTQDNNNLMHGGIDDGADIDIVVRGVETAGVIFEDLEANNGSIHTLNHSSLHTVCEDSPTSTPLDQSETSLVLEDCKRVLMYPRSSPHRSTKIMYPSTPKQTNPEQCFSDSEATLPTVCSVDDSFPNDSSPKLMLLKDASPTITSPPTRLSFPYPTSPISTPNSASISLQDVALPKMASATTPRPLLEVAKSGMVSSRSSPGLRRVSLPALGRGASQGSASNASTSSLLVDEKLAIAYPRPKLQAIAADASRRASAPSLARHFSVESQESCTSQTLRDEKEAIAYPQGRRLSSACLVRHFSVESQESSASETLREEKKAIAYPRGRRASSPSLLARHFSVESHESSASETLREEKQAIAYPRTRRRSLPCPQELDELDETNHDARSIPSSVSDAPARTSSATPDLVDGMGLRRWSLSRSIVDRAQTILRMPAKMGLRRASSHSQTTTGASLPGAYAAHPIPPEVEEEIVVEGEGYDEEIVVVGEGHDEEIVVLGEGHGADEDVDIEANRSPELDLSMSTCSEIIQILSTIKLNITWNKTALEFINHFCALVNHYNDQQVDSSAHMDDSMCRVLLQTAVSPLTILDNVKNRQLEREAEGHPPITFDDYVRILKGVATVYDQRCMRRAMHRQIVSHKRDDDDDEESKEDDTPTCRAYLTLVVMATIALAAVVVLLVKPASLYPSKDSEVSGPLFSHEIGWEMFLGNLTSTTWQQIQQNRSSPQAAALQWLADDPYFTMMPIWRHIQRFALATIFFSLQGREWRAEAQSGWLSYEVPECEWKSGHISPCDSEAQLKRLVLTDLPALHGSLPDEVHLLSSLQDLVLSADEGDMALMDLLPRELGDHPTLKMIDFSNLRLEDSTIPTYIGLLTQLHELHLDGMNLVGTVPTELGKLTKMTQLTLSENRITGTLPTEFSQLTNLDTLWMARNQLSGPLPTQWSSLQGLLSLFLHQNALSGTLPQEWSAMSKLVSLRMDHNELSGTFPIEWGHLDALSHLDLEGNDELGGKIPQRICSRAFADRIFFDLDCDKIQCCIYMTEEANERRESLQNNAGGDGERLMI